MSTTTATEISSNPNSSCRLLVCLNSLPFYDQRVFRSLLGHTELLRLSACCRSLRSSIRNDRALWQQLYHSDFLSGAYYGKEMEFVLWCVRTDVNNPCTSDKRADLLENVDWYNTYRRRVSTENNWRFGRYNTTHIDMEYGKDGSKYYIRAEDDCILIKQRDRSDEALSHYYNLKYLPHSNLRSSNNIEYNSTLSTSPNVLSLGSGNAVKYNLVLGGHYIAVYSRPFGSDINYNVKILSRKHGGVITTFDVPVPYLVEIIEGKWVLLMHESYESSKGLRISGIIVFDIDNNTMCPGNINDTWDATCFYKTTNDTAIVYTARIVKDDDTGRIEWALYQFSSNNHVVQLRNGWFQLPEIQTKSLALAYNSSESYMIVQLRSQIYDLPFVIHNVALGGQCSAPRNCYAISDNNLPIPLLQLGFRCSMLANPYIRIWTDLSCSDDQILRFPGATAYHHVMGSLYLIAYQDPKEPRLLVDINTQEIIRKPKPTAPGERIDACTMNGTICRPYDSHTLVIQEYGES